MSIKKWCSQHWKKRQVQLTVFHLHNKRWEQNKSNCSFTYKRLDLFRSHPSINYLQKIHILELYCISKTIAWKNIQNIIFTEKKQKLILFIDSRPFINTKTIFHDKLTEGPLKYFFFPIVKNIMDICGGITGQW